MQRISVIICSYNPRDKWMLRVLKALQDQTLPLDQWELLLVDNASGVPLEKNYDVSWHPHGTNLREEMLGKMFAWTKGINKAKGEILVFVDDDNVLAPDYLEQVLSIAESHPFIGAWGGSLVPEFESIPPSWIQEHKWRLGIDDVQEDIWSNLREGFETKPAGAGMCVRHLVAEHYLKWCRDNEMSNALDRKGNAVTGYGDMNLALCAIDLGLGTGKFARLRLTHLIATERLTLDYFVRQAEGDASSLLMYRAIRGFPLKAPRDPLKSKIKRFIYRILSGKPREFFEIDAASRRGEGAGWDQVREYRKLNFPNKAQ
jgi:glycosyltransferase involved in cell wall biosynthesis